MEKVDLNSYFGYSETRIRMVAGTTDLLAEAAILTCRSETSQEHIFQPQRVLLLSKTSRFDYEKRKHADLTIQRFRAILKRKGSSYWEMKRKHLQQQLYVNSICKALTTRDIEVRIVSREEYTDDAVEWADAIFCAGGDGTFLIAAAKVKNNKPVIGFNTDPFGSEGHLCITRKADLPVDCVVEQLLSGRFSYTWRQRIRVTVLKWVEESDAVSEVEEEMCDKSDKLRKARLYRNDVFDPKVPVLALNEIFVGESHAARVSSYEIQIDDGPVLRQKSSGLTISTGTGSTSWHYNINRMFEQDVTGMLHIMNSMGILKKEPSKGLAQEICQRFNEKLTFEPQSPMLAYTIREPLVNATYPETIKRGFASRIWIRSRCSDAHLVLDSGFSVAFNYGTEILLETHQEDALCSVMLV